MLVTVVMVRRPGGGDEAAFRRSAASVGAQEHPHLEVRLVEDGPDALARGIRAARGEYVQLLASGDRLHPRKIAHQVRRIEACPVRPAFVAAGHFVEAGGRRRRAPLRSDDPWTALLRGRLGSLSANLVAAGPSRRALGAGPTTGEEGRDAASGMQALLFALLQGGGRALLDDRPLTSIRGGGEGRGRGPRRGRGCEGLPGVELCLRIAEHLKSVGLFDPGRLEAARDAIFAALPGTRPAAFRRGAPRPRVQPARLDAVQLMGCRPIRGVGPSPGGEKDPEKTPRPRV